MWVGRPCSARRWNLQEEDSGERVKDQIAGQDEADLKQGLIRSPPARSRPRLIEKERGDTARGPASGGVEHYGDRRRSATSDDRDCGGAARGRWLAGRSGAGSLACDRRSSPRPLLFATLPRPTPGRLRRPAVQRRKLYVGLGARAAAVRSSSGAAHAMRPRPAPARVCQRRDAAAARDAVLHRGRLLRGRSR